MIKKIFKIIINNIKKKKKKSYSYMLFKNKKIIKRKILEESLEYVIEIKKKNKKNIILEFCDLLYHIILPLIKYKIKIKDVKNELKNRIKPN
ncbi:phosphoribosyl-ATP diphosphatase [Candidatus Vidania fulgoroideorum]